MARRVALWQVLWLAALLCEGVVCDVQQAAATNPKTGSSLQPLAALKTKTTAMSRVLASLLRPVLTERQAEDTGGEGAGKDLVQLLQTGCGWLDQDEASPDAVFGLLVPRNVLGTKLLVAVEQSKTALAPLANVLQAVLPAQWTNQPESGEWEWTYDDWLAQYVLCLRIAVTLWVVIGVFGLYVLARQFSAGVRKEPLLSDEYHVTTGPRAVIQGGRTINSILRYLVPSYASPREGTNNDDLEAHIRNLGVHVDTLVEEAQRLTTGDALVFYHTLDDELKQLHAHIGHVDTQAEFDKREEHAELDKDRLLQCLREQPPGSSSDDRVRAFVEALNTRLLPLSPSDRDRLVEALDVQIDALLDGDELALCDPDPEAPKHDSTAAGVLESHPTLFTMAERVFVVWNELRPSSVDQIDNMATKLQSLPIPPLGAAHLQDAHEFTFKLRHTLKTKHFEDVVERRQFLHESLVECADMIAGWQPRNASDEDDPEELRGSKYNPFLWTREAVIARMLNLDVKFVKEVLDGDEEFTDAVFRRIEEYLAGPPQLKLDTFRDSQMADGLDYLSMPDYAKYLSQASQRWKREFSWDELTPGKRVELGALNFISHVTTLRLLLTSQMEMGLLLVALAAALYAHTALNEIEDSITTPCHLRDPSRMVHALRVVAPGPACPLYGDAAFTDMDFSSAATETSGSTVSYRCWGGSTPSPDKRQIVRQREGVVSVVGTLPVCDPPKMEWQEATNCAGTMMTLSCPNGALIIESATYEATTGLCSTANAKPQGTCEPDVLPLVSASCALQPSCELLVTDSRFAKGCAGTNALKVSYACMSREELRRYQHKPWN